jgi:DNA-binding MurR/RpiR family transcriptional regulator
MSEDASPSGGQANGVVEQLTELVHAVHLTPTQRVIVRTLIQHADRAAYLSGSELADLAQVSQPSVTRLANALGFDGYRQLRAALREARPVTGVRDDRNDWQRSIDFELAALRTFWERAGHEQEIRETAAVLTASQPLLVAGRRSAVSIAHYFTHFAARFLPDVRLVSSPVVGSDLDVLLQAKSAGATAMLVILFPPYAGDDLLLMDQAKDLGIELVCLTDSVASLGVEKADHVLFAPVHSTLIFDSYGVPMIAANVLLAAMAEIDPKSVQNRLEEYEAVMDRHEVYRT